MTPHDLAAWAERAKPEEQRAVLEAAWPVLRPEPPAVLSGGMDTMRASVIARAEWRGIRARFTSMLDAEAWESAALMLVPEGWEVAMYFATAPFRPDVHLENEATRIKWEPPVTGNAATTALALIAAIARAQ